MVVLGGWVLLMSEVPLGLRVLTGINDERLEREREREAHQRGLEHNVLVDEGVSMCI